MRLAVLGILALASPAFADDGAPLDEPLRGNVLVWHDATFYTDASDGAPAIHVAALPASVDRARALGRVVAMRVVATKGEYVEVEPAELDCTWSRVATSDDIAKLHLYVKRADLAPVLAKPFARAFDDGTRVELKPGVPVATAPGGGYSVALKAGVISLDLPSAAVAHAYAPEKVKSQPATMDREYEVAAPAVATLGDKPVTLARRRASGVERRGATTIALFESRCATLAVAVPTKSVRPVDDDGEASIDMGGNGAGVLGLRDQDYIAPGTVLSTPSGRAVAAAAKPIYLASAPRGKLACVDRRVRVEAPGDGGEVEEPRDADDKLRLCAPASKVVHEKYRHAWSNGGATGR
jgi:hypothetical protein